MKERAAALSRFASLLRRTREELGHPNARAFFEAQGGRAFFGCTYRAYLNVESGLSVPGPALLEKLVATLWVAVDEPKTREFVRAMLEVVAGDEAFVELVLEGLSGEGLRPEGASRAGADDAEVVLTPEQTKLLYASAERYWCFTVLDNDAGRWTPEALSRVLDFPEAKVAAALKDLEKAGLAAKDARGAWSSPPKGRLLFHPKDQPYRPEDLAALRGHWDLMARRRGGELVQEQAALTRCSEAEYRGYLPFLMNSLLSVDRFTRREKGPDTAFFLVEVLVRRLLPL